MRIKKRDFIEIATRRTLPKDFTSTFIGSHTLSSVKMAGLSKTETFCALRIPPDLTGFKSSVVVLLRYVVFCLFFLIRKTRLTVQEKTAKIFFTALIPIYLSFYCSRSILRCTILFIFICFQRGNLYSNCELQAWTQVREKHVKIMIYAL